MVDIEEILVTTVNKILKENCSKEIVNEAEEGKFPDKLWNEIEQFGLPTIAIPEQYGGTGFDYKDALNLLKALGKYSAPIPLAETLISNWLLHECRMEISDGPLTITSPLNCEDIIFRKELVGWSVNGVAKDVPFARYSKKIVVLGQTTDNQSMIAVLNTEDVLIECGTNIAGEARDIVTFKEISIGETASQCLNLNVSRLYSLLALSRVALMAGALERILEMTIEFANLREQFGRPIGKFQAVKQQIAILASEISSANIAADCAIDSFNNGSDSEREIMIAKCHVGKTVSIATSIAHQVHAAIGFTHEHPLQQSTRRLWAWREEYGSENFWAKKLGEAVLSQTDSTVWDFVTS